MFMKNFFLGAVAVIVILSSVGGAYYIGMQTKPTGSIPTPTTTAPIPTVLLTPAHISHNCVAGIAQQNVQGLAHVHSL